MSFIDPGLRETWARDAERARERCRRSGAHEYVGSGERCVVCSAVNPDTQRPRVTLVAGDFRAVFHPPTGNVVIEKRSTDSLGADRWDVIDTLSNTQSRSEKSHHHIIALLSKGAKP